jgi:hypothetical protein
VNRAARRASTWHHYYGPSARRSRVYLPPRRVRDLSESIDPETAATASEVGLQLVEAIDQSKPAEDQLDVIEALFRERFEAVVAPLVESMREQIAAAIDEVAEATDLEPEVPDVENEGQAREWIAAAVLIIGAAVGAWAVGWDIVHGKYAQAAEWALGMLLALYALYRQE